MEKRTVIAVALIILVIIGYQAFIIPRFAPVPPAPAPEQAPAAATVAVAPAPPAPVPSMVVEATPPPTPAANPELIAVDRPLYTASFSNVGGTLESWQLKTYTYGEGPEDAAGLSLAGKPLELVRPAPGAASLAFTFLDPATQAGLAVPMAVRRTEDGFSLEGTDANGLRITRKYVFSKDNFTMDVMISLENMGQLPRAVSWEMAWGPGIDRFLPDKEKTEEAAVAFAAGSLETVKVKKPGEMQDLGPVSWVGVGNRYFVATMIPKEGSLAAFVRKRSTEGDEIGLRSNVPALGPRQAVTYRVAAYFGPKERGHLAAAGHGLEQSVDYGWFSWLALPFLSILQFCHRFLRSYGLAILALTLLVKAALFPITYKMYRSMKKMQEMQPRIQSLKAKFKNDAPGLQQATMALYKEHKVNPMAGCLPMLVQIPVFFALYRVLYNAIELRGAGFLYINDLSQKDPTYITPILMGVTMLIQQRMSPTVGDPTQAKIMMFMPVIMTAMFINFSSGLVLYFLFSNVLSITEQKLFRMMGARERTPSVEVLTSGDAAATGGRKKRRPSRDQ